MGSVGPSVGLGKVNLNVNVVASFMGPISYRVGWLLPELAVVKVAV